MLLNSRYVSSLGAPRTVDVPSGLSLMEGAIEITFQGSSPNVAAACFKKKKKP